MKQHIIHPELAIALEESEAGYWSKFYQNNTDLKCYTNIISGAFAGAMPELDILAMNRVIGLGMRQAITPEIIDDILHFYKTTGSKRFFIQLSPYVQQANLRSLLKEKGFRHHNNWAKLMYSASDSTPVVGTSLEIKKVSTQEAEQYGQIIYDSFDWEDECLVEWLAKSVGKESYQHYFACYKNQPIAAAALHIEGIYASMAFAGTLEDFRGLGAQSLLLKTRILEAKQQGCQYIIAETAENKVDHPITSYRNMQRFGFQEMYLRENWIMEF